MYRSQYLACFAVLAILVPESSAQGQGVLQQLRQDVQNESESKEEDDKRDRSRRHCDEYYDCEDNSFWNLIGTIFVQGVAYGITAPFWGPPVLVGDDYSSVSYLSCYPYQHDGSGFILRETRLPRSDDMFVWSLRVRGEYADDFDSLTRYGGRVLWESRNRFGLDTSIDYRREWLETARYDELWNGDFNIVFRFAESEQLMMRTGLGTNFLALGDDTEFGFNFTYAADWFPERPWIFSAEIDWGWLGHAGLFHARTTAGVNIQNVELYTGYDYFDVGSAQIGGLVAGVQLWY